ncbi:hypothetical protein [Qaidamihabitans albus]|uniref:hypothetical protein n=1 Tax=Qaidamihabitans albus TaxID=2795733 RepID=UPI0027DBA32A|nr:hypothetical protein [Qaidamihabitans albus]
MLDVTIHITGLQHMHHSATATRTSRKLHPAALHDPHLISGPTTVESTAPRTYVLVRNVAASALTSSALFAGVLAAGSGITAHARQLLPASTGSVAA